jgi:death-on-curing family protein
VIVYLRRTFVDFIFGFIAERFGTIEEVPNYNDEHLGVEKLCGIFEQIQSDVFYPTLLDKAAYLLIGINKGHFFSNGNKRLALVATTVFLTLNDITFKKAEKEWYRETLELLFPEYASWTDFDDFTHTDFATYNLSIMVADSGVHGISHDELKRRLRTFFELSTEPTTYDTD